MLAKRFKKLPVEIEAIQWTGENTYEIFDWVFINDKNMLIYAVNDEVGFCLKIDTPEGLMRANKNDWIIRGVKGEFYPCKPDIFEKTYQAVRWWL